MTPRERVLTLLRGDTPDQVPWFGDLDYWATAQISKRERPADFKLSDEYIEWHRQLGVGFYLQGYFPFQEQLENCPIKTWTEGQRRYRTIETPKGSLSECWLWSDVTYSEAPIERLVKTVKDLPAYRYFFQNLAYTPDFSQAERRQEQVAEMGVVLCYTPRSPFMRMVAIDAGIENIVMMYMDDQDELAETIGLMKTTLDHAVALTVKSPAEIIMTPENLSAEVVGPNFFELYMRDIQKEWSARIQSAGKFSCIHMDGTLKGLLREEAAVGLTFIEAMTPAPTGDLAIGQWADYLGDTGTIAWGGIPGAYFTERTSDQEFDRLVREVLEVMTGSNRYVLGVADQVPPDGLTRRVKRVRQLVDAHGAYTR